MSNNPPSMRAPPDGEKELAIVPRCRARHVVNGELARADWAQDKAQLTNLRIDFAHAMLRRTHKPIADLEAMEIIPLSASVGAQIRGVNLAEPFDERTFDALHQAWLDHLVIVFREQSLSDQDLVEFSARFGTLDAAPVDKFGRKFTHGFPELTVISNVVENGQPIGGLGNFEAVWHTDMSYNETPPKGSALYSREVPDSGGDTGFLNMYAIYESLPDALRDRLCGLQLKHDATHNSAGELRSGMEVPVDLALSPGAIHPLVRTHPDSGRRALFLGRRPYACIIGLTRADSDALLDELWAHCEQLQFSWHHQWDVGDLLLWDNRCAMHRRDSFDAAQRRLMVRTQIQGDRPR